MILREECMELNSMPIRLVNDISWRNKHLCFTAWRSAELFSVKDIPQCQKKKGKQDCTLPIFSGRAMVVVSLTFHEEVFENEFSAKILKTVMKLVTVAT